MSKTERPPLRKTKEILDYDTDSRGCLVYWDIVASKYRLLEPSKPISDPNCVIAKVGQQNLLPNHFTLKPKDLEATEVITETGLVLGDPIPPGLSTFLFFGSSTSQQNDLLSISQSALGRQPTQKNRLYFTQVRDIEEAGWQAVYAPLVNKNNPPVNSIHILIVPNSIRRNGVYADAQQYEKIALSKAFVKWTL